MDPKSIEEGSVKSAITIMALLFSSIALAADIETVSVVIGSREVSEVLGDAKVDQIKVLGETKSKDGYGTVLRLSITYFPERLDEEAEEGPGICTTKVAYTYYQTGGFDVGRPLPSAEIEETLCWQ